MPPFSSNDAAPFAPYRVVRSRRRTLAIEVRAGGEVLVRAPVFASDVEIRAFVQAKQDWVISHVHKMKGQAPKREWTREETLRLRSEAHITLPALVERTAQTMDLHPAGITITAARTRYGSCSAKGRLSFSCYLMDSPSEAVEYVVAHELCHLRHMNHGPEFYSLLEKFMPDWKARKKKLKPI